MENGRRDSGREDRKGLKSSFAAGVAALVFLVIGYQSALFMHKASVLKILENKDAPDTVFVIDRTLAERILKPLPAERLETMRKTLQGKDVYVVTGEGCLCGEKGIAPQSPGQGGQGKGHPEKRGEFPF